jgi:hypothetical protein
MTNSYRRNKSAMKGSSCIARASCQRGRCAGAEIALPVQFFVRRVADQPALRGFCFDLMA